MRHLIALGLILATAPLVVTAQTTQAYDLIFKEGTLEGLDPDAALVYSRDVSNPANPAAATRDTGRVVLTVDPEEGTEPEMATLTFRQDEKFRGLGAFPASIGNPMIMYFMETTARDMGETAGGSPFYIRNRLKEALLAEVPIESGSVEIDGETIQTQTVTLEPFAGDPNAEQMRGFGAMTLTVKMSEDVPGWYVSLVAEATPAGTDAPVYRSALTFAEVREETEE